MPARTMPLTRFAISVLVVLSLSAPLFGEDVPLLTLDYWMWYNEHGWRDIERGRYDRAEQQFNMAIKEIRPYWPANRRLMARTYCDLARVLYYQERYAEAEPLAKWALSVRDADKKATPDLLFQGLYTLASIQLAQEHYADAEPHFKRALAIQEKELTGGHSSGWRWCCAARGNSTKPKRSICVSSPSRNERRRKRISSSPIQSINT
jgi:tetratricopeptide (TPR) repeat protein